MRVLVSALLLVISASTHALTFSYGRYTGDDAATQAITGLGFQPDLLIVKADGAYQGWMVHKDMSDGDAKGMVGSSALVTDRISTLDANGFTVGTHDEANKNAVIYYFIAFDATSDFVLGSFVGTGAETISGLSFQPDMVWLMGSAAGDNGTAVLRSDLHDNATLAWDGYDAWDHIGSFTSDGFTSNWRTDGSNTYYWVAVDEGASGFETNEFTGNATDDREITAPGFQPEFVMLIGNGGNDPQFRLGNMAIDQSMGFAASGLANNGIQLTTPTGFQIGDDSKVNGSSTKTTWLAYGGGTNVLPVELTKFNVSSIDNNAVQIEWETASELNSSHFEVERASDGSNFESIDQVPSSGTSFETQTYEVIDYEPIDGINYYRLKAVDIDQSFEYSDIKTVSLNPINLSKITSFPNPAIDQISLSFNSLVGETYLLKISDSNGLTIYSANLLGFEGPNEVNFNISTYPQGMYFITILSSTNKKLQAVNFIKR